MCYLRGVNNFTYTLNSTKSKCIYWGFIILYIKKFWSQGKYVFLKHNDKNSIIDFVKIPTGGTPISIALQLYSNYIFLL